MSREAQARFCERRGVRFPPATHLLKLGIVVSNRSIRRYRWRGPRREHSQSWRTFLRDQLQGIWAADLFVVQTIGFRTLYVLFFISHGRRELIHFNVTASPTAAWIWRQLIEATAWSRQPRHLIHDRDKVYGADFGAKLAPLRSKISRHPIGRPAGIRSRNGRCEAFAKSVSITSSCSTSGIYRLTHGVRALLQP